MIRFALQLYAGWPKHEHECDLCGEIRRCGCCGGSVRMDTCDRCFFGTDCPRCWERDQVHVKMELEWQCSDSDADGNAVRTVFAGKCTCGNITTFVDLHDGRGPLRTDDTTDGLYYWARQVGVDRMDGESEADLRERVLAQLRAEGSPV